jgi:hypothetical protein
VPSTVAVALLVPVISSPNALPVTDTPAPMKTEVEPVL